MGRMYSANFAAVAVTAAQDLFEVTAPADASVVIHEIRVSQHSDTDSEMLHVALKRGATSTGTGGTQALTPAPLSFGDPAFGGVVDTNNTGLAASGTIVTLLKDAFNVLNGWVYLPTPEARIILSPSQRFTCELVAAPADSLTMNGTIVFEEVGG